jgi:HSP20 family molecular chaperone IbpA
VDEMSHPVGEGHRPSRVTLGLVALSVLLAGAVATLAWLLWRQQPGSDASAAKLSPGAQVPLSDSAPRPYVNLDDPRAAPAVPPAPPRPQPDPVPDPLDPLFRGFDTLFDDPSLKKALDDLAQTLQRGAGSMGRIFRDLLPSPSTPKSPGSQSPGSKSPGSGVDPFDFFGQTFRQFFGLSGSPRSSDRIQAEVRDEGRAYVVRCRFPQGAPETASFRIRGDTLVVKARFQDGEQEQEVQLPGPVHPLSARSELIRGELVVTLPKASMP